LVMVTILLISPLPAMLSCMMARLRYEWSGTNEREQDVLPRRLRSCLQWSYIIIDR
jgi:hypothetical protein